MSIIGSRKSRRAPKKAKKKNPKGILFLIGLFFLMLFVGFKIADSTFASVIANPVIDKDTGEDVSQDIPKKNNITNILFIGTDEREGENEPVRSDALLLVSLNNETKEVKILSIPRDTRVKIPGRKNLDKINHALAFGGVDLSKETVEEFLGVTVDYYIKTNFQGFSNIIDILGGITYNVEKKMYKPEENIDLEPGLQKLNGYDALAYVRYRSDGLGDIGRVERQQKFLSALIDNVASINTIWKIPDLVKEISRNVHTDLGAKEILTLATKYSTIKSSDVTTYMVPGTDPTIDGVSYWIADQKALDEILKEMELK